MTDHAPPAGRQQQLLAKVDVLEQLPPEEVAHLASRSASVRLGGGGSFNIVGGPALIVAGLAFIPTPGPSYIIIVIGM
jgi:hypothetical protein